MVNDNRQKGFETLGEAAQRLLQGLERAKNKSGHVPVKIAVLVRYSPSTSGEKTGERRAAVEFRAQSLAGVIPFGGEGETERELGCGRVGLPSAIPVSNNDPGTTRPTLDDTGGRKDRADVTLQRMGE